MTTPKPVSPVERADSAREVIARAVIALPFETRWEVADAVLAEFQSAGYAVVPVEPTEAMIVAGIAERHDSGVPEAWSKATANIYRAMLTASDSGQEKGK